MAEKSNEATDITLQDGVALNIFRGDIKVEFHANGYMVVYRNGAVVYPHNSDDDANDPEDVQLAVEPSYPVLNYHPAFSEDDIGKLIKKKGIYVGTWEPEDRDGNSLGKIFNLFAAPEDIGVITTFNDAVKYVSDLQGYHDHNGFNHNVSGKTPDEALYDALQTGSYNGEWFIPPRDVLNDNLYENKDAFDIENAFVIVKTDDSDSSEIAHWYWSCTESSEKLSVMCNINFKPGEYAGKNDWDDGEKYKLSTRLVRAEPRPSL